MTPNQNEPTDLVSDTLNACVRKLDAYFEQSRGEYPGGLLLSTLKRDIAKALTLAKLQSEAVRMLTEFYQTRDIGWHDVRALLRAIEEAKK